MLVELGGGSNPHPRADIIIDLNHPRGSIPQDATEPPWMVSGPTPHTQGHTEGWVLASNTVDEVYCSHFLEHIPKGQPLINVMNEAWRILKPGGTFVALFPLVGYTDPETEEPRGQNIGWQPWADPTHVSYWWMPEAFLYFCEGPFKPCADYGIRIWAQLGAYTPEPVATDWINHHRLCPDNPYIRSFWSVRSGWEACCRLVKP